MTGLALQIDGKWAVLGDGDSVNIENNSPVWGEGNSFSLPFELDIEANRHIIGNADQITGESVYKMLDGKRAVLYTLGIPVYYGKIKMDDEVELSDGKVDVTLVSGNLTFDEMIEGMNCQEVELLDEIIVGEGISSFTLSGPLGALDSLTDDFPAEFMRMKVDGISTVNVSNPYPLAKYCNTRICYQLSEEKPTGDALNDDYKDLVTKENKALGLGEDGNNRQYVTLEADRPLSGLCFFVLYFLDCLFRKLGISYSNTQLRTMEDMNRLAFFSTQCNTEVARTSSTTIGLSGVQSIVPTFRYKVDSGYNVSFSAYKTYLRATSKNFPKVDVTDVIDALKNGFGVKFLYNNWSQEMLCVYVKDILKSPDVYTIGGVDVHEVTKTETNIKGFELLYSGGGDDDKSYNYEVKPPVTLTDSYNRIRYSVSANNKHTFVDKRNGNSYRVKIDEEATTIFDAKPSVFEVGEFNKAQYGDCTNESFVESVEIGFTPIVQNDVVKKDVDITKQVVNDTTDNMQKFATFLDVEMQYPSMMPYTKYSFYRDWFGGWFDFKYTYYSSQRAMAESGKSTSSVKSAFTLKRISDDHPIWTYDSGLTLGIMRGPGNTAGVEEYDENYDGEGNSKYTTVASNYAFHSDTVDNYARLFDYNGAEPGGVDTTGRFSLKLRAETSAPKKGSLSWDVDTYMSFYLQGSLAGKSHEAITEEWNTYVKELESYQEQGYYPITESYAQKRGLFDKFYAEYAYFVVNRKIVRMTCRMEMADLLNIDWTKRYKIGEYVGFINKYSYSVSSSGISDVELEMYYI